MGRALGRLFLRGESDLQLLQLAVEVCPLEPRPGSHLRHGVTLFLQYALQLELFKGVTRVPELQRKGNRGELVSVVAVDHGLGL